MALDRPIVRAPELPPVEWLNTSASPSLADLRGQVVLVHFWDFTCLNCLRTLPTLRDWHHRYQLSNLIVLGIHTPEFPFARGPQTVRRAIGRLGVRWPVALDNQQEIRTAFANRVWPAAYLVDAAGYLRLRHEGDGGAFDLERALRGLLVESSVRTEDLPAPLASEVDDGGPGGFCLPGTRELQIEQLGNGSMPDGSSVLLSLPESMEPDAFYVAGEWREVRRGLKLESNAGELVLPFEGGAVHAVLAAQPDDPSTHVEAGPAWIEVHLDGDRVAPGRFGQDLILRDGASGVRVEEARSYHLLQSLPAGRHQLRLSFSSPGTTVYSLSFEACVQPRPLPRSEPC